MALKLYNTLTRSKEVFKPLRAKKAGLYTCGPTVYNYAHIGNLRTYIFEDILRRTLEYNGYRVNHIMNITDVEDKIIRDSQKAGKTIYEFTAPYEKAFFEDLDKLNIKKALRYPKATEHIKNMIKLVAILLKKGLAYQSEGSVYFDISKFKNYGRLSGLESRELRTSARIDSDEYEKESAEDFVLWKASKEGEPSWPASFGEGRPGWHIECSAMSMKYLGPSFDIHAGAVDLIFPHHENEIAQSEGATGKPFARYFIEGEHLLVNGEKMAKSLGNFFNLRDLEAKGFDPLAFRYLALTAHYRSKLNFTWESLEAAQNALGKLRAAVLELKKTRSFWSRLNILETRNSITKKYEKEFLGFLNDDLETPRALAFLWDTLKSEKLDNETKYRLVLDFDKIFGLGLAKIKQEKIPAEVLKLAREREERRKEKKFGESDEIRRKMESLGWTVDDTPRGPKIRKV